MSGEKIEHGYDRLRKRFTAGEAEGATVDSFDGRISALRNLSESSMDPEFSRQLERDISDLEDLKNHRFPGELRVTEE